MWHGAVLLELFEVVAKSGVRCRRGGEAEVWQTSLYLEAVAVAVACEVVVRAKSGGHT
jgi:hypothetical protein